jgi:RNA polymerase sigma-70 factor (ECF subfamily)
MASKRADAGEVGEFLRGDSFVVGAIRDAVRLAVRSFQFSDTALNNDLVQDTLTRVFLNLTAGHFRGESSLATYARRVARNACLEHLRKRRFEASLDPEVVQSSERWSRPDESLLWAEEHLRNLEIFSRLTPDCRSLMMLVFVEGRSYREIGTLLGLSEGAVKTRVHRCRSCFRQASALQTPLLQRNRPQRNKGSKGAP